MMPGGLSAILITILQVTIFLYNPRPRGISVAGKVMGSMLGPNRVISKDVKYSIYCFYVRCTTIKVWVMGNILAPNRRNSVPCIVRISR